MVADVIISGMIGGRVLGLSILLLHATVGVASAQLMVCVHSDGRTQIEPTALLCCEPARACESDCESACSADAPESCPDDNCQDYPLTMVAPQVAVSGAQLDLNVRETGLSFAPALLQSFVTVEAAIAKPSLPAALSPPNYGPRAHLRTVVLRP